MPLLADARKLRLRHLAVTNTGVGITGSSGLDF